eukprot:g1253.t1
MDCYACGASKDGSTAAVGSAADESDPAARAPKVIGGFIYAFDLATGGELRASMDVRRFGVVQSLVVVRTSGTGDDSGRATLLASSHSDYEYNTGSDPHPSKPGTVIIWACMYDATDPCGQFRVVTAQAHRVVSECIPRSIVPLGGTSIAVLSEYELVAWDVCNVRALSAAGVDHAEAAGSAVAHRREGGAAWQEGGMLVNCDHCGEYNFDTSRRCSGCREVCFCSEECALAGWKRHKKRCKHGGKLSKKKKKKKKEEKDQKTKEEEEEEEGAQDAQDAQKNSMSGAAGGNGFSESTGEGGP